MILTVLCDNNTFIDHYYLGEPGFSLLIETDGKRFLLDTGYSGIFYDNAQALGLSLKDLDGVILSHNHNDHTGGLGRLLEEQRELTPLYAHPELFRSTIYEGKDIGCPYSKEQLETHFDLKLTREPLWLTDRLLYLGEIPRNTGFEPPVAIGESGGQPDLCLDDTALAYRGEEGIYVLTGCSHSGIGNIIEYAKEQLGTKTVAGVIGGLHLLKWEERAAATLEYLKKENIPALYPCHCTGFTLRARMYMQMPIKEVGVGLKIQWN